MPESKKRAAARENRVAGYYRCRLGIYDPLDDDDEPELFGPILTGSAQDQQFARLAMKRYYARCMGTKVHLSIALFPVSHEQVHQGQDSLEA